MTRTRLTIRASRVGLWGALLALLATMILAAGASAAPTRAALAKKAAPTGTPPTAGKTGKPKPANGLPPGAAAPATSAKGALGAKGTAPGSAAATARHPIVEPSVHPRVVSSADDDKPLTKRNPNIRLPRTGPAGAAPSGARPRVTPSSVTGSATPRAVSAVLSAASSGAVTARPIALLAADPCGPTSNAIVCENSKPGNPDTEWDINGAGDSSLQGFTTDISANVGDTVHFKINSTAAAYRIDVYRLGYYQGLGARKVASFTPQHQFPQPQPACVNDAPTGLVDCGTWAESASWAVPSTAVSGVYVARLVRLDNGGASHVVFVVRDDGSHSDLFVQTSDTTWQAYNDYGGNSLYKGSPVGRAYKVSYNRPVTTRVTEDNGHNWVFSAEYPMIRFLERNGYDISYTSGADTARRGALIKNHKVFMSSGHDEYWSGEQRSAVESARDVGVSLAFFSANSVYWKTRWEPSIDGSNTSFRTIVCYKETKNTSPQDPMFPTEWGGTWRDPRYSPPSNGGRPENALIGTMYKVDPPTDFNLQISSKFSKLRFWRNSPVANLAAGQTATLATATLGYEYDVDADNGFRPAGLVDLTQQTEAVQNELKDFGAVTGPGNVTHSATLYRAPSGALVFGAGTIQWAFGLDEIHDGGTTAQDSSMQQAAVNLLADMGIQPATLMSGMTAPTTSTDTAAPTSTVTASATHGVVAQNYTINGTATDTGGAVGGVEVSVDGGSTWHPATISNAAATTSWSYTFQPTAPGPITVQARAADDSGNIQSAPSNGSFTIDRRICPCTIFGSTTPGTVDAGDANPFELGVSFRATIGGTVTGVRFYKSSANTGTHTGSLWSDSGQRLATGTFTGESGSGWQTLTFSSPVTITAGTTYIASYHTDAGHYAADTWFFKNSSTYVAPLLALPDGLDGGNGVFSPGPSAFPSSSFQSTNYWVDVVFNGDTATDINPPNVAGSSPMDNASSVPLSTTVTASFDKPIAPGSLAFTLSTGGSTVPVTTAVGVGALSATLTPNAPLAAGTSYTASVSAADTQGHAMAAPLTWTFRTGAAQPPPGTCPCTIWSDQQQPVTLTSPDAGSVELGVKVRASTDGYITGVRFFKGPQNTGTHTGSLWRTDGTPLATATFTGETSSGWQQVTFDPAVQVTAGTTYIASYHTDIGHYSANQGYFAAGATTYGPLTALQDGTDGGNGVYAYGPAGTFPSSSYQSGNYWVDPVFQTTPPPPTPPQVQSVTPKNGATGAALSSRLTATFNKSVQPGSITFGLTVGGSSVAGTVDYDDPSRTATFTPSSPLAFATTYNASVTATATNGLAMPSPFTWSFATGTPATCPCSLWPTTTTPGTTSSADTSAYELGVRFRSDQNGFIGGVRFYKGTGNTGTHTGTLWTESGQLLATGTFTGETAAGWQTLTFDAPVAINANTGYVASYHTDTGHYAYDQGYFAGADRDATPLHALASAPGAGNGVYRAGASGFPGDSFQNSNYWVDVVFSQTSSDTIAPHVTSVTPADGATNVSTGMKPAATFSEPVDPASVAMTLSSGSGAVTGSVGYDATTRRATFTPAAPLAPGVVYTATARATDVAGNAMPSPFTWTFTTVAGTGACPCTLLGNGTPAVASSGDTSAIELGVSFTSDVPGQVTGVRFYKGAGNTGTHTGTLWSASGAALATGTFTNETASGWQTLTFATPVSIVANTTYVASYHTDTGNYSYTSAYYVDGLDATPLHAGSTNGLYLYGSGGFPTNSFNSTNYWVDVVVG